MVMIVVMSVGIVMMNMMVDLTRINTIIRVFVEQLFCYSHRSISSFAQTGSHMSCALSTRLVAADWCEALLIVESIALQA